jgi:hypothetical protein
MAGNHGRKVASEASKRQALRRAVGSTRTSRWTAVDVKDITGDHASSTVTLSCLSSCRRRREPEPAGWNVVSKVQRHLDGWCRRCDVIIARRKRRLILFDKTACEKRLSFFECFPYVCPEPVLVK